MLGRTLVDVPFVTFVEMTPDQCAPAPSRWAAERFGAVRELPLLPTRAVGDGRYIGSLGGVAHQAWQPTE